MYISPWLIHCFPQNQRQVVAQLKKATLDMLGEGPEAAQKMTRMINPQAGSPFLYHL